MLQFLVIYKWDREKKSVFEKVNKQKVKWTVHSPNKQKFEEAASDALRSFDLWGLYLNSYIL